MRNLSAIVIFLFLLPLGVKGQQNHVPNGSFEYYTSCPSWLGPEIDSCIGWKEYSNSPDYFNSCATLQTRSVPLNNLTYQYAHDGNAYVGGGFNIAGQNGLAEYIGRTINPLSIGSTYEVSMSVNLVNNASATHNGLGIFLYKNGPSTYAGSSSMPQTPQIDYSFNSPITDTQNWTRLTKLYTADSAYDHIVIGGFINVNNFQSTTLTGNKNPYFFFDSVVIKWVGKSDIYFSDSLLCAGDTIKVAYRVNDTTFFASNNIFSIQLSNANGSFINPIILGAKTSKTSDTIMGIVPHNISNGTGYRVRIIASAPSDTSEDNGVNIKIHNPDSSAISITSNSPLCEAGGLVFSASTNVSPTTYAWTGPNGFTSTSATPSIGGAGPVHSGNYYVTTKFNGCEVKDTLVVTVKPLPAKPVANNNGPICAGETLNLTSSSTTSGVSWSWTGPGSYSSSAQNPNISSSTTAMSGDYIVTADLNGCNRKDTTTVLIKPIPAPVTTSSNTPLCAGDTLKIFSTTSSTGATYTWAGPNSFTSATQNGSIANSTPAATGWYKMTVDLNGCTYKDSTNVTVYPIPATPVASYSNPLCVGETLRLNASNVTGASYSWTGANSFSSSSQNPTRTSMQFGDTGTYSVTATANGCTSPAGNVSVKINPVPFAVILSNPADSICNGAPVLFTALPNNHGGTPAYQWYVNMQPVTTGVVFSTSTLNNGDIIRCDMTENTKCSVPYKDESNDIQMTVLPWLAPAVSISANPSTPLKENEYVTFTATPTNAGIIPKYQWKRNGQNVVGATGAVWSANTLNDNDEICVEVISSYKCPQPLTGMSNCIKVKVLTEIGDISTGNGIVLYPNPNNGKFVVQGKIVTNETVAIEVINAMGQLVYKDKVVAVNGTLHEEIDLGHVATGIYMLRMHSDEGVSVVMFRVQQ